MPTPQRKTELTARYRAQGSDGRTYDVIETTDYLNVTTVHDTGSTWQAGMKTLRLDSGEAVNRLAQGRYQIVGSKVLLTFDGP